VASRLLDALGRAEHHGEQDNRQNDAGNPGNRAAALAAGLAVCAVGTHSGGSVRLPAAFCGLTGLKTTERRLPLDGIIPLSHTLDTPGPLARSVLDALEAAQPGLGRPALD
jgi:aspartyl-tRNA(Asn)/glutamyl-tRNA(Gln) amidotransferase subunit A